MSALPSVTTGRELAFVVLREVRGSDRFIAAVLEEAESRLPQFRREERGFALELANGLVRRQATLDALLAPHVARPRRRVEDDLWLLLQLGAYQFALLSDVPEFAAIHETVALARRFGKRGWDGFVNGVLRNVQRTLTNERLDAPASDALPLGEGRYRKLARTVFPDPSRDPAGYASTAFSFPKWLIERWQSRDSLDELCRLGFWFNSPAPLILRVNLLTTTREKLLAAFAGDRIAAVPGVLPEAVHLQCAARVASLPHFADGWFTVQDESAMSAVDLLNPQPGEHVLDLCAAPGTKTTHLAERMQNSGRILAADVASERLRRLEENCRRLRITIVAARQIARDGRDLPDEHFDAALVDVPCSNTGVLGKRPEARWRIKPADLVELPRIQRQLLQTACNRIRPGGRVVYSTCSIEPDENEQVVRDFLAERNDWSLVEERRHVPGLPADGGYQALLVRAGLPQTLRRRVANVELS